MSLEAQGPNSASYHRWEDAQIAAEASDAETVREMGDISDLLAACKVLKSYNVPADELAELICENGYDAGDVYDCVRENIIDAMTSRKGGA